MRSVWMMVVFDIAGPLAAYYLLRAAGAGPVTALVWSGVFPAAGVILTAIRHRRADALGVLVLAGIVAGAVVGVVSRDTRLVLDESSVPTAMFALVCLGSLITAKPLMYRLALEFAGPDTPQGRELTGMWRYDGFRHVFRVITVVWGIAFAAEAAARVVIVASTSTGTALAVSNVMPYAVAGVLIAWTVGYGRYRRRQGERQAERQAAQE